ncbi:hypothetical protein [Achromobacter sp.]|uniref:hypothetical protein n=1 Tax=Achromobacter sp. TaxID=134375 RepID=UPI0028ABE6D8|nr:hypothetical protein [Achromobacter sp.]
MRAPFGIELLFLIAGPGIWLVHFLFIYTVNAIACARPGLTGPWLGLPASSWVIVAGGVLALGGMAMAAWRQHERVRASGALPFRAWLTAALCALSALAVVWETLPVFLMPSCH